MIVVLGVVFGMAQGKNGLAYGEEAVSISLDATRVEGHIDEKIYGHFLEHIFHSVNGGLWGEMVWNRSFEEPAGGEKGQWMIEGDTIKQSLRADNIRLVFGDREWRDYEYSLEAQKISGAEGFLILFRVAGDADFYWYNIGGWGNQRHALEKGVKGSRWGVVSPVVRGRIERNKWYRIRVRCAGPHLEVWLDDEQVLDYTDERRAHLAGAVGLGTWNTAAKYRNIKVKSLDGKTLFEGLPEIEQHQSAAKYWKPYGKGQFQIVSENPHNSDFSQMIVSEGEEAGVQQENFFIRKGQTYTGSYWARSDEPAEVVLRWIEMGGAEEADTRKIFETTFKILPSGWRRVQFNLKPNQTVENAGLQIGVKGGGKVWLDQVSLMSGASGETGGFRADLLQAVAELKPPIIRWPGGCFASSYQWKQGIGPQHTRLPHPRAIWDDLDVYSYGTDEFIKMCQAVGAEPLIVVNIGSRNWNADAETHDYRQDILDWIEYCNGPETSKWGKVRAANGHPKPYNVKYWEIDNETWHMGASAYVGAVRRLVPAMKKVDPSMKIVVCGSGGFGMDWNREVIKGAADLMDYLSIHHYENPNRFAEGPRNYERFIRQTGEIIAASANPKVKIYCSEWNAQSTDWRTGLYAGGLLNGFERCGDIFEIGGPALFLRHVSATAWDNAFINFDRYRWFPAPNYVVMKLWREHYARNRISMSGKAEPLNAVATRSKDDQTIYFKAVNPEDKSVDVRLTVKKNFRIGRAKMRLVAPDSLGARNTLEQPNVVRPIDGEVKRDGQRINFRLPRWSVAVVTIEGR